MQAPTNRCNSSELRRVWEFVLVLLKNFEFRTCMERMYTHLFQRRRSLPYVRAPGVLDVGSLCCVSVTNLEFCVLGWFHSGAFPLVEKIYKISTSQHTLTGSWGADS